VRRNTRPSLRNGFTAYNALSPATNSSCHRRRRISGSSKPGWVSQTSAGLTPATGARTTRFCRTQLPPPKTSTSQVLPVKILVKAFKRRSSCAPCLLTVRTALRSRPRPTLPRPPQPAPTFVTMANAPLLGTGCSSFTADLGWRRSGLFSQPRLDGANHLEVVT
jgi:hypothetical protein